MSFSLWGQGKESRRGSRQSRILRRKTRPLTSSPRPALGVLSSRALSSGEATRILKEWKRLGKLILPGRCHLLTKPVCPKISEALQY